MGTAVNMLPETKASVGLMDGSGSAHRICKKKNCIHLLSSLGTMSLLDSPLLYLDSSSIPVSQGQVGIGEVNRSVFSQFVFWAALRRLLSSSKIFPFAFVANLPRSPSLGFPWCLPLVLLTCEPKWSGSTAGWSHLGGSGQGLVGGMSGASVQTGRRETSCIKPAG